MAVKFRVVPTGVPKLPGDMLIDVSVAVVTVREAVPLIEPEVAVMVTEPWPSALATPLLLIVATEMLEELQVALLVRFWVLPSL